MLILYMWLQRIQQKVSNVLIQLFWIRDNYFEHSFISYLAINEVCASQTNNIDDSESLSNESEPVVDDNENTKGIA